MKFEEIVSRMDEEIIQQIVGRASIQVLNVLDIDLTRISELKKALLKIYSPSELLFKKEIRNSLFDLLKPDEVMTLFHFLGKIPSNDNYQELKTIRFNTNHDFEKLLSYFEIENLPNFSVTSSEPTFLSKPNYPLFSHQRDVIKRLKPLIYSNSKRALLHMPTGSGKTRTAMNVICDHFRSRDSTLIIWLAHTEELCDQAAQEFEKAWENLGDRTINITRYWGSSKDDIASITDGFIVGGLMKMFNLLKNDAALMSKLASRVSLVIMDEAHMAIAPTYRSTLEVLLSFDSSLLGLSATPGRTWNNPVADLELSAFFERNKVTLNIDGYENPVDYLVEKGYLALVNNTPLLYKSGIKVSENDLKYLQDNLELPEKILKALSEEQARNVVIIQKVEELVTRHKRIIVFALNVEHSNLLATCLQVRNVNGYSITSNTEPTRRKRLIEDFKTDSNSSMVLCNYGILTTGFDAPQTSCAVICRPTDSLVLYSQMVGRAIRGTNAGGNESAEIVTVVDTVFPGFDRVQTAFFNWEDIW